MSYMVYTNEGDDTAFSSSMIGGQPTVNIKDVRARWKFTLAHEYGHIQTQFHAIAELGEVFSTDSISLFFMAATGMHTFSSPEWQSAATVEGFAHYYSLLVWWDHDTNETVHYLSMHPTDSDLINLGPTTEITRVIDTACQTLDPPLEMCPEGVANENDWMSALWNFSQSGVAPEKAMMLVSRAYVRPPGDDLWPVNEESGAFWINFDAAAGEFLEPQEYDAFIAIAEQAGINR